MKIPRPCEPDSGLHINSKTGSINDCSSVINPFKIFWKPQETFWWFTA